MATTSNFAWETPDDTDLVKDGAASIRTLGSNIDSSMADLLGGSTGQVLAKNSGTNMDFTWSTPYTARPSAAWQSGSYYAPQRSTTGSAATLNTTYFLPIFVPYTTTVDRITVSTASNFAGTASVRLGIFNDTNGKPDTLVLDAGTVSCTTASSGYQITISQTLNTGIYWLAANMQSAATTSTFYSSSASSPIAALPTGFAAAYVGSGNSYLSFQQAGVSGAFGTATATPATTGGPIVSVRAA